VAFKLDHRNVKGEMLVRHEPTFQRQRAALHEIVA
jgi:hypothetical protein